MSEEKAEGQAPKLFVSYSWTDQAHIDWVLQLATDLRSFGVEAIIDRWHLREGQDAHSFMESMVRSGEVNKAILVCDQKYVNRANNREGGVGAESQIVTSTIYSDVGQTKFTAVVRESSESGEPMLPNFLASRIFIDFRVDELYPESLRQLVRWAFDKPLHREPEVGPRPAFLNDQVNYEPIRFNAVSSIGHSSEYRHTLLRFFDEAIKQKSDFSVKMISGEENDETIYKNIFSLAPVIGQVISEMSDVLLDREFSIIESERFVDYLSNIFNNYNKGPTNWSADPTKFYGQFLLTCVLSRCVKFRRFDTARTLLASKILKFNDNGLTAELKNLSRMNSHVVSLEARNARLKLNRASLHSDIIKEICSLLKIDFVEYMQADLIFCLSESQKGGRWWPDSLLYATDLHGAFPWFAKATEPNMRREIMSLIGVSEKKDLLNLVSRIDSGEIAVRWQSAFSNANLKALANFSEIMVTYG